MNSETFSDNLRKSTDKTGSIICVGFDPAPVEFPVEGISGYDSKLPNPMGNYSGKVVRDLLIEYFKETLREMLRAGELPGAFKPNLGYYRMYDNENGFWGSYALEKILAQIREETNIPIILDAKDADIGRTSAAYATSKLKMKIDAMTVHPEMGSDSVEPFFKLANKNGQGIYVLTRTSNPSASEFQNLDVVDNSNPGTTTKVYEKIAEKVVEWHEKYPGTVGSVVGATSPDELREIAEIFHTESSSGDIPLLIPGVGTQGGTVEDVMNVLNSVGYDHRVVRINSSSGTMYRSQKDDRPRDEHAIATGEEVKRLNSEVDKFS